MQFIKSALLILILAVLLAGCTTGDRPSAPEDSGGIAGLGSSAISGIQSMWLKANLAVYEIGDLKIRITPPKGVKIEDVEVYLNNLLIGNAPSKEFVLVLRRGMHTLKVTAPGCANYEERFVLLGRPNNQFLNVELKKALGNIK